MTPTPSPKRRAVVLSSGRPVVNDRAFTYYTRLGRLKTHLEQHIGEPLSAGEAARIAGVSQSYFSAFFHDRVGVRFTSWTRLVRIERARQMLDSADVSITDVAARVGFHDLRTFERAFKRTVSVTPREYKRRVRPGRC
jgi:transcriptional regulator GlxA family with amidase domain